ncbi:filamentous hemagglutinin N-terminal domain-containing protein [Thiotrichales bacterium HSG1]|nr:filamentous hemagglutinin N-terminal domain-containing protein [Thiotrichales bacterium HSG1]
MIIRLIGILLVQLSFIHPVVAEVVFDGSLGPNVSLEGPQFDIEANHGKLYGGNLFHSFQQFNLDKGDIATFSGPDTVNNIIGRVTGGVSSIDGTLHSTIPQVNLYLLNSEGFIFGENAELKLPGSFYITTANRLYLNDSGVFSTKLGSSSVLTSSPPSSFGFLDNGKIIIENSKLGVVKDKTLAISSSEINIDGGRLRATSGRISLTTTDGNKITSKNSITMKNNTTVDVGKQGNGDIYISSGQLFMYKSTIVTSTGVGDNSGVIDIEVGSLLLDDGANIESRALYVDQKGNNIVLNVDGKAVLKQKSKIRTSSHSRKDQAGNSGNIILNASSLNLSNDSLISTTTYGQGFGGNIEITITRNTNVDSALISADSLGFGNAGNIHLNTANLIMNNGTISTATDKARGGNITINARTLLKLSDSKLTVKVSGGFGNGGNIAIGNPNFFNMKNSYIRADASGGNGGMILIVTGTPKEIYNSEITASSETGIDGGVKIDGIYNVGVTVLPIDFLDTNILIKHNCAANTSTEYSSFFIKGRGGLPNAPDDLQSYFPNYSESSAK